MNWLKIFSFLELTQDRPIGDVVCFSPRVKIPYKALQFLQGQIEVALTKRKQAIRTKKSLHQQQQKLETQEQHEQKSQSDSEKSSQQQQQQQAKSPNKTERMMKNQNIWNSFIKAAKKDEKKDSQLPSQDVSSSSSLVKKPKEGSISFKFHEGYTNAVRRNVYIKDFL